MGRMNRQVRRIVAMLFSGWCIIWIFRSLTGAVHPEIMETVGRQSSARMGLISSCYFAGYVVMQIPGGFIMDRLGKWRILIPSFALMALGFLFVGIAPSIELIYVGSLLAGVGSGTYYSGAFSLSSQNVPSNCKYYATAVINSGGSFGMLIGYIYASGAVRQLQVPWQAMLFLLALMTFVMILLILKPAREEGKLLRSEKKSKKTTHTMPNLRLLLRTLFTTRMIVCYFFYFCTCYGYYMIVSWLPSFLQNERGLSGVLAGYASSVIAVVSIPGALFLGKIVDHFSGRKISFLTVIQIISGIMLICLINFKPIGLLIVVLAFYGISGKQAVDPLIVPHVTEQLGNVALSTGLGVFNFFGMLASVIAPLVTGIINDATGTQAPAFYIAVALLVLSSLAFGIINRYCKYNL